MNYISRFKLINFLVQQCHHPTGIVGKGMIQIWNKVFIDMAIWGLGHIQMNAEDVVLEIGFGGGALIDYLTKQESVAKIYGIDISQAALKKATARNKRAIAAKIVDLQCRSVEQLGFTKELFTKIFAVQTHIYWEEIEQTIAKIFPLLKAGGELNIICEKDKIHYHLPAYEKPSAMMQLLRQGGFHTVHFYEERHWIHYQCLKG